MMKIDNVLQGFFDFEIGANGNGVVLEMAFRKWEDYALMFRILQAMGFSIETKEGIKNQLWVEHQIERHHVSFNSGSGTSALKMWHNHTYLEITSEGNLKITGEDDAMVAQVASWCLHSNPPLACSVQNGV